MKNILVFLDIDGVLNNHQTLLEQGTNAIDPENIRVLNKFLKETNASIVITSTWRIIHSIPWIQTRLEDAGFEYPERIIGATIRDSNGQRGDEIDLWLRQLHIDAFVIFDDDNDMSVVKDKLVLTSFKTGLLEEHVEKAKQIITEQLNKHIEQVPKNQCKLVVERPGGDRGPTFVGLKNSDGSPLGKSLAEIKAYYANAPSVSAYLGLKPNK